MKDFDVIICGGGLVGLTLANALGDSHLTVALIDGQSCPVLAGANSTEQNEKPLLDNYKLRSGYAPRVSAINLASKNILENLGVWQEVNRICAFDQMSVRDTSGSAHIEFSAEDIKLESLGYIVENRQVLASLANKVSTYKNLTCYWNTKVEDVLEEASETSEQESEFHRAYLLYAADEKLACDLLVGADGGNSRIRELANIKTIRWSYDQEALVTTIQTEQPHGGIARQWFTEEGPLAFLPLADPNFCSIVWSLNDVSLHKQASEASFCASLSVASEGELGEILGTDERFSFPLAQQHAFRYVKSNLALIGDAAHTIHPLAGQGANLGFADANALAIELKQAKFSESNIGDLRLLRRYEQSRQAHNLLMTSVMEAIKRLYTSSDPGINWLRNTAMKAANGNDMLKSMMTRLASGL